MAANNGQQDTTQKTKEMISTGDTRRVILDSS